MPSHIIHPIPPVFDADPHPDPRFLSVGQIPRKLFFLRAPTESFLEALSAPAKGRRSILHRGKEGISAAEPHRRLGHHPQLFHRRIQRQFHPRCCSKRPRLYPGSRFHPGDLHKRRAVWKNVRPLLP